MAVPAALLAATAVARFLNGWATFDLPHYDQGLWLASRGHSPASTVFGEGLLEDHFGPAILAFVPLYRIVATPIWLLLFQAVAAWASVWQISRRILPHLGSRRTAAIGCALLLSPPVAFALLFDAHPVVFAVPFALAAVFAIQEDRPNRGLLFGLVAAAFRADIAYAVLAAYIFLPGRTRLRLRPFVILFSYVALATYLELSLGKTGGGSWDAYWGHLGASPTDVLAHPWRTVPALLSWKTLKTAFPWLAAGGFLCLAKPRLMVPALAVALPTLLSRWFGSEVWGYHYGIAPTLLLAPAWMPVLQRRPGEGTRAILYGVLLVSLVGGPFVPSPLVDTKVNEWAAELWHPNAGAVCIVKGIPAEANVSAQMRPANFLAHRRLLLIAPFPFRGFEQLPSLRQPRPDLADRIDYVIRHRGATFPLPSGFVADGSIDWYERFRREATTQPGAPACASFREPRRDLADRPPGFVPVGSIDWCERFHREATSQPGVPACASGSAVSDR